MNYIDRIEINSKVMLGKPVIKGTRITIELILEHLGDGYSYDELLEQYPRLTKEDITAALSFAGEYLKNEEVIVPV